MKTNRQTPKDKYQYGNSKAKVNSGERQWGLFSLELAVSDIRRKVCPVRIYLRAYKLPQGLGRSWNMSLVFLLIPLFLSTWMGSRGSQWQAWAQRNLHGVRISSKKT